MREAHGVCIEAIGRAAPGLDGTKERTRGQKKDQRALPVECFVNIRKQIKYRNNV